MEQLLGKIIRWGIYTVLLALVPLTFSMFRLAIRGDDISLKESMFTVLSRGDLLLIAVILCGGAMGELSYAGRSYRVLKMVSAGGATIILLFSAFLFADVSFAQLTGDGMSMDHSLVRETSIKVFCAAVVCSGSCVALSDLR